MRDLKRQKIRIEFLWWIFTLVVVILVLLPIIRNVPEYPFYVENTYFIVAFITFTRYIFLLPTTFIARAKWIKIFVIAIAAILFFVMTTGLQDFHFYVVEKGLQSLVGHLHVEQQSRIIRYIQNEMIFFGVGSIISGIALPIRMIISLWRMRNRGTV